MILIIISILFYLLDKSNSLINHEKTNQFECLIGNNKYTYEYLSSSNDHFTSPIDNLIINAKYHHIYLINELTLKKLSNVKWIFIQMNQLDDTYYLKSKILNEYLCASDLLDEFGRRDIYSIHIRNDHFKIKSNKIDLKCVWKFQRTLSDYAFNSYFIRNAYYTNESLFSAITKTTKYKRNVYLWNKVPSNDKYKWIIDC